MFKYLFIIFYVIFNFTFAQESDPQLFTEEEVIVNDETNLDNQSFINKIIIKLILWIQSPFDFEHGAVIFIILYLLNYLYGRTYLSNRLNQIKNILAPIFDRNFAALGFNNNFYQYDSVNKTRTYASGRRNCRGLICNIELIPRQDLYYYFYQFFDPRDDIITFEVLLPEKMSPIVLGICPLRESKKFHSDFDDLKDYTQIISNSKLPSNFVLMSDTSDIITTLFPNNIQTLLFKNILKSIYISDQRMQKPTDRDNIGNQSLRVSFRVPYKLSDLESFVDGIFKLVDIINNYKPQKEKLDVLLKKRKIVQDKRFKASQTERQEQIQEKKAEEKKQKEDEYYKLSPEQRKKWEAKQEKERIKEQKRKLIKKSKMMH